MFGTFFNWLDHRTGYRKLMDALLLEHIPGGAKWRYVWGSTLAFVFMVQLITGILLMTAYSPGDTTAWGSVYFIQYEMDFGWLIRGLHHFGSQTMVVLLGIHMLQVVIAGAHLPPREINWWLGLALMGVVLGLSLTGYLLPWDQKGFFATQVATNILGAIPGIGTFMQKVVVGGPTYGNHTLTHFYALHVGVLPPLLIVLLVAHIAVFRRHGITTPPGAKGEGYFWPDQAFRDMVMCMIVFGIMLCLVVFGGHGNRIAPDPEAGPGWAAGVETGVARANQPDPPPIPEEPGLYQRVAKAGKDGLGANLDAPADPLTEGYPARPEWYFLFLFQLLKYFDGPSFLIGAVVIPNGVALVLFLLPLLGYGRMRKFGHFLGIVVVVSLLIAVAMLTVLALADDSPEPYPFGLGGGTEKAKELHKKFEKAAVEAKRAVQLAAEGIPEEGGRHLLRGDPLTKGPKLFETNCAVCHKYGPDNGHPDGFKGLINPEVKYRAPDLAGFGSEKWIRGLLDNPGDDKYFGLTKLEGMKNWRARLNKTREKMMKKLGPEEGKNAIAQEEADFNLIAAFLADQAKPKKERQFKDEKKVADLTGLFLDHCGSCHTLGKEGNKIGPDLTDYASEGWIRGMIMDPGHPTRYGKNNEMPAFRSQDGPGGDILIKQFLELNEKNETKVSIMDLTAFDRELIIRWMTRDYRVIFGGKTIGAVPK